MDRNIPSHWIISRTGGVALRKESVDRNGRIMSVLSGSTRSLSARRAWIEIIVKGLVTLAGASLSARRAWIEIFSIHEVFANFDGRSPQGERG